MSTKQNSTTKKGEDMRKKGTVKNEDMQLEYERLFGQNIDHYLAMNICSILSRVFSHIHFDFLDDAGKETFYKTYFSPLNALELTDGEKRSLHAIERLTPSDYRNVRQQLFYLEDENLTAQEIIDALRLEAQSRDSYGTFKGLGEEKHGIGFN